MKVVGATNAGAEVLVPFARAGRGVCDCDLRVLQNQCAGCWDSAKQLLGCLLFCLAVVSLSPSHSQSYSTPALVVRRRSLATTILVVWRCELAEGRRTRQKEPEEMGDGWVQMTGSGRALAPARKVDQVLDDLKAEQEQRSL